MENTNLQLADICDLEKLYKMIGDWSNATGMSAILTDNMGEETMKAWGKSLFCRMLLNTFIEKSYYIWKAGIDIRRANEARQSALANAERQRRQLHTEIQETLDGTDMGMWSDCY